MFNGVTERWLWCPWAAFWYTRRHFSNPGTHFGRSKELLILTKPWEPLPPRALWANTFASKCDNRLRWLNHYGHSGYNHSYRLSSLLIVFSRTLGPFGARHCCQTKQGVQICSNLEDVTTFQQSCKHCFDEGIITTHHHDASSWCVIMMHRHNTAS